MGFGERTVALAERNETTVLIGHCTAEWNYYVRHESSPVLCNTVSGSFENAMADIIAPTPIVVTHDSATQDLN